ncbi:hypothetical protein M2138_001105 [Dysgonomonadaceae bacterium PH5-43]|nr:hypothetical protein [Dysgonomonadaceae bacterium PH5-43]
MIKTKSVLLLFLLALLPVTIYSQNVNTVSPYTQYGYGQLADPSFGSQRGMGGIGYGLRNSEKINPLNPASYSAVDSMTFMLDFAVKGQTAWLKDGSTSNTKNTAGIEYIAMQFPLSQKLGMGVGLSPVSHVGYEYRLNQYVPELDTYAASTYKGKGGFNKAYATVSYNFLDRLSVGVNLGYMFGNIYKTGYTMPVTSGHQISWNDTINTSTLTYELGLQYTFPLENKDVVTIGAVFSPKIKMSNKTKKGILRTQSGSIISDSIVSVGKTSYQMPETYSIGFTYNKPRKFTLGADFQYQRWGDADYYDITNSQLTLTDRMKINVGAEYIPNYTAGNVFKKMRYRAGAYYSNSYVEVDNKYGYKDMGLTLGFGIPMVDKRSFINLAFEYNIISPDKRPNANMIDEKYFRFTLSYTFNELWFFKRKLQ